MVTHGGDRFERTNNQGIQIIGVFAGLEPTVTNEKIGPLKIDVGSVSPLVIRRVSVGFIGFSYFFKGCFR